MKILSFVLLTCTLFSLVMCNPTPESATGDSSAEQIRLIDYVNPLIGTKNMGHTFPGAAAPFGMVQLSPETSQPHMFVDGKYNPDAYRYCAGYQYDDSLIYGFSHTHFSGTGHSDLGDFLTIPASGTCSFKPEEYALPFHHKDEKAEPAYYAVKFPTAGISAEMTATERVGVHKYQFEKPEKHFILVDYRANIYQHEDKNVWTFLRIENDSTISGYRQTYGWARTRLVYFVMRFSKPFTQYGFKKFDDTAYKGFYRKFDEEHNFPEMAGKEVAAWFEFGDSPGEFVEAQVALSAVSTEGAMKNLLAEVKDARFEDIKASSQKKWEKELSRIQVQSLSEGDKISFYTALYHTFLSPVIYEDVDGKYRGLDQTIHESVGFENYTIFSLWDTYRSLHPLFNLIQPERNNQMIMSMLAHQKESVHHMLPIWSHYSNENWCMIGYHAVSVITDAFVNGTTTADAHTALEACLATSRVPYFDGLDSFMKLGFVAEDLSSNSVSKTLEYAYDDWCIAQLAKIAGEPLIAAEYEKRATNYEHVFDASIGFMRPKLSDGSWRADFDPMDTHGQGFIEGNAYNYGLYIPQNPQRLVEMMHGNEAFESFLDSIFEMEIDDRYIEKNEDITRDGMIGTYVHGNEPGHHIPYLYNYTGNAWKTQERVRMILNTMYLPQIDGLCGNDDAGQMSAWYIMSALGFYPLCPGSGQYEIGSPLVISAKLDLGKGKQLLIETVNQSDKNIYVKEVRWNGELLDSHQLSVKNLLQGGCLQFTMDSKPRRTSQQ